MFYVGIFKNIFSSLKQQICSSASRGALTQVLHKNESVSEGADKWICNERTKTYLCGKLNDCFHKVFLAKTMIDNRTHFLAFFFSTLRTWGDRFRPLPPPRQWSLRHWTSCPSFEAKFQTQTWLNWKARSSLHHNTLPFKYGAYTEVKLCQKDVPTTYNTRNCIMTRSLVVEYSCYHPSGGGCFILVPSGPLKSQTHSLRRKWVDFLFLFEKAFYNNPLNPMADLPLKSEAQRPLPGIS